MFFVFGGCCFWWDPVDNHHFGVSRCCFFSVFKNYMVSGDGRTPLFPKSMEFCLFHQKCFSLVLQVFLFW